MEGADGASAGGVNDAVGASQVESVGDPAGGDVAEQAGERVLLPGDVGVGDPLDDRFGGVVGDPCGFECASPDRVSEPGAQGDHQLEGAGDAEDYADPVTVEGPARSVAGVLERFAGDQEAEELGGVGRLEVIGGDAELERGEVDWVEVAAAPGVGHVGGFGVAVPVVFGSPVGGRDLSDRVEPIADVGPVARQIFGLGKQAAHSDDRHRHRLGWIDRRIQVTSPFRADAVG